MLEDHDDLDGPPICRRCDVEVDKRGVCPSCGVNYFNHDCLEHSTVKDSRPTPTPPEIAGEESGPTMIRRRRVCEVCDRRWTTVETTLESIKELRRQRDEAWERSLNRFGRKLVDMILSQSGEK